MNFRVGQKVVCVDDSEWPVESDVGDDGIEYRAEVPVLRQVYTVRNIHQTWPEFGTEIGFLLEEIRNPRDGSYPAGEVGFRSRRFRSAVERKRKTSIAIFKKLLIPSPERVS